MKRALGLLAFSAAMCLLWRGQVSHGQEKKDALSRLLKALEKEKEPKEEYGPPERCRYVPHGYGQHKPPRAMYLEDKSPILEDQDWTTLDRKAEMKWLAKRPTPSASRTA